MAVEDRRSRHAVFDKIGGILEGQATANRDEQFRAINARIRNFIRQGNPALSIDTKKKERVGEFKNRGQAWRPKGKPREVNTYDFPSWAVGTAIPYGAYDVHRNQGFVNVGITHDTTEFAVESLRQWWMGVGRRFGPIGHRPGSLSLSSGDQQVELGGASLVFVYQLDWKGEPLVAMKPL